MARRVGFALSTAIALALVAAIAAQAESHVRIVRLSYIDGQVQMDRATGQGLERAILNAPIVEGTGLVTGGSGLAEVEFEDQSTLRLADNSEVKFRQLLVNDAGAKVNEIEVVRGIVYFDAKKDNSIDRIVANGNTFIVQRNTEMRLNEQDSQLKLAVFKGDVQFENQTQTFTVKKKETLTMATDHGAPVAIAPGVDSVPYDAWNNERAAYTSAYVQKEATFGGPSVSGYGLQDLNYYGGFFYAPGFGYAWQPYGLAGWPGWNPYTTGAWMFCPGMGYSFASAYPWGWLPYHYGSWAYLPNAGWAWLPGNGSTYKGTTITQNFQPLPKITRAPAGFAAPAPPAESAAQQRTVMVGTLGSMPAYIPGGRVPPDFRSVLPPTVGQPVVKTTNARGTTFVAPASRLSTFSAANSTAGLGNNVHQAAGHVFAPPARASGMSTGWEPEGFGQGPRGVSGAPGSHAAAVSGNGHSSGGTSHH